MGIFLNRGTDEFQRMLNSTIYVDKTDMIDFFNGVINTEQSYICVSRPRRFGKSITANMIAAYYEKGNDSASLFEGKKLSKIDGWKKQMNQYDVIRLDMADLVSSNDTPQLAFSYLINGLLEELETAFPSVQREKTDGVADYLAKINDAIGAQFVIIIDEWDCFFRDDKSNQELQQKYINLLRSLFKGNRAKKFTALAYITGILPIKKYNSESALNNFYEYTMTSPKKLAKYIGFTDEEVRTLCEQYHMDYEKAKEWYDGYSFTRAQHIYGPASIVQAMLSEEYENYWSKTVAFNSLTSYITMNFDGLKDAIVSMLGGNRVKVRVDTYQNDMVSFKNKDDVLTGLIHLGYLAYDAEKKEGYIPNKEVRQSFEYALEETDWTEVITAIENSDALLDATLNLDVEEVARQIEECHMQNTSILKYNDENSLSCVITLAYYTARNQYHIVRELPAGRGFADLVFVPKRNVDLPAMIVELKWKESAETAISQIKENKYVKALDGYQGKVLLVGISYEKVKGEGNKEHHCRIEEVMI